MTYLLPEETYLENLKAMVKKRKGKIEIINPWSDELSFQQKAEFFFAILEKTYKGSYSIRDFIKNEEELIEHFKNETFLTWLAVHNGTPIACSGIEVASPGVVELVSSARLRISEGRGASAVMIQRIIDILTLSNNRNMIWAIDGNVRLAKILNNKVGEIQGGAPSQHLNNLCGLKPFLLCVPRSFLHGENDLKYQQFFNHCRKYTKVWSIKSTETIFCPERNSNRLVSLQEIATVTYKNAFGEVPPFNTKESSIDKCHKSCEVNDEGRSHYTTITLSGYFEFRTIVGMVKKALKKSRFVEFVIPNRPINIQLQEQLLELGVLPLGILPGGIFTNEKREVETSLHFGLLRDESNIQFMEIEVATEFIGTKLHELIQLLRTEWSTRGKLAVNT